ncbi:MAG: septal ring lytic transglycosylase RlpA family protein [Candidatus Omnitrophota bacterium]|nr:MAG: septal ring lytic transglycosylase RlpA family protein [Candidatus Omnitrophota bacterium]
MKSLIVILICIAGIFLLINLIGVLNERYACKGVASWYGEECRGKKTASGEVYNPDKFTAAHRRLPFGTLVRVTNLENECEVTVRINDRGPYIRRRIIDLSLAAARQLGIVEKGLARVEIDIIMRP